MIYLLENINKKRYMTWIQPSKLHEKQFYEDKL